MHANKLKERNHTTPKQNSCLFLEKWRNGKSDISCLIVNANPSHTCHRQQERRQEQKRQ